MASRAGSPPKDKSIAESSQDTVSDLDLKELKEQYSILADDAKQLMTEKMYLEN